MPPQLTVGSFKPTGLPGPQYGGQFQYPQVKAPTTSGVPGPQYGGQFMYPNKSPGGGGVPVSPAEIPTAAPITAPGSTGGAFGGMPDFSSQIGGSWEVGAAESSMASQMAAARASFQAQLRQGFIDLGYAGAMDKDSGLSNFSKYIDKDTLQKAIDNKYSAYANIKKQEAEANAINDASLAARGGMTSGTQTETTQDTIGQAEQARYEGLRNFLGQGQAGLSNLTSMQNQLAQGVLQARFAAAQRLAQEYAFAHPYQPPGVGGGQVDTGYSPVTDPNFPGGPAAPNYPLVGTDSSAWMNWLKEHGTSGY